MIEQITCWLVDNIVGAFVSACIGAILGVGGTSLYYRIKYSIKSRSSQKGGDYSKNIQVNGNISANNINNK